MIVNDSGWAVVDGDGKVVISGHGVVFIFTTQEQAEKYASISDPAGEGLFVRKVRISE